MSDDPGQPRPPSADEERRYVAVRGVDPGAAGAAALLLDALADPSWRVRHAAAERLAEADPARAVPLLVAALGADSTPGRRNAAAEALAQIGPAAVPALTAALGSSAAEFRTAAVEVLGEIGDQRAATAVATVLGDADANARAAAAEALGKLGGEAAVAALHGALAAPPDTVTARAVLEALAVLEAPPAVERLRQLSADPGLLRPVLRLCGAGDDPAAFDLLAASLAALARSVREAALQGLGARRLRGQLPPPGASASIRAAVPGLSSLAASLAVGADDPAVRAGALTVLQLAGVPGDVHAIAAAAEDDRVRPVVAEVLDELGPVVADALHETLPSLSPVAAVVVLAALARWRDERAIPALLDAVAADDPTARALAIDALGRLGDARAIPALFSLLTGDDRVASARALGALLALAAEATALRAAVLQAWRRAGAPVIGAYRLVAQLGEEPDVPFVRAGLRSPDAAVRAAAAHAAGAMPIAAEARAQALPELLDAVADEDASVRAEAARSLGDLAASGAEGDRNRESIRHALALALRDRDPSVRAAAALALAEAGGAEHAPAMAELARDPATPGVAAAAAVRALTTMGRIDAVTLAAAAAHPDGEVVKEVVRAAGAVAPPEAARLLLAATAHPRWDVRRAAALGLARHRAPAAAEALRRLAHSERDPMVLEAIEEALRALEARP